MRVERHPCQLPQVVPHITFDVLNAAMPANSCGVARDRIRIVRNAVDMTAIAPRTEPLGQTPRRMFANASAWSVRSRCSANACGQRPPQ